MGRSNRQTADYFPHYVGEKSRTKFILEKNWGNDGYAFWFKLLELLCAADGQYYDCWDKMGWEYLLAVTGVTAETAEAISRDTRLPPFLPLPCGAPRETQGAAAARADTPGARPETGR